MVPNNIIADAYLDEMSKLAASKKSVGARILRRFTSPREVYKARQDAMLYGPRRGVSLLRQPGKRGRVNPDFVNPDEKGLARRGRGWDALRAAIAGAEASAPYVGVAGLAYGQEVKRRRSRRRSSR